MGGFREVGQHYTHRSASLCRELWGSGRGERARWQGLEAGLRTGSGGLCDCCSEAGLLDVWKLDLEAGLLDVLQPSLLNALQPSLVCVGQGFCVCADY